MPPSACRFFIAKTTTGPPLPEKASENARDFLRSCFLVDPKARPTASQLLQHPFVAGIDSAVKEAEKARGLKHSL